ncbi:hypothetical protein AWC38_SpisGene9535 [Stylophora pistillata]|uniref:Uncharacterized protein n=1 Tax=Stylophora pistillata TaxID=50429 RepID=A0A2B4S8X2_STYPI|nr:hypothetical protein AWC38_SpisGene9535 [Stylophora pistillata]
MDWRRVLLWVGICVIISTCLEEGVEAFHQRTGRRRSSGKRNLWVERNEIHPLDNLKRREEILKIYETGIAEDDAPLVEESRSQGQF